MRVGAAASPWGPDGRGLRGQLQPLVSGAGQAGPAGSATPGLHRLTSAALAPPPPTSTWVATAGGGWGAAVATGPGRPGASLESLALRSREPLFAGWLNWLLRCLLSPPPAGLSGSPPLAASASQQPATAPPATRPLRQGSGLGRAGHSHTQKRVARACWLPFPPCCLLPSLLALRAPLRRGPGPGRGWGCPPPPNNCYSIIDYILSAVLCTLMIIL